MSVKDIGYSIQKIHVFSGGGLKSNWLGSLTPWRMKRMDIGWSDEPEDDRTRRLKIIDQVQVHVPSGDGWRERIIRRRVRVLFKHLIKFTYVLEADEEDGKGWWDEGYLNSWPGSRMPSSVLEADKGWSDGGYSNSWASLSTFWRWIKERSDGGYSNIWPFRGRKKRTG